MAGKDLKVYLEEFMIDDKGLNVWKPVFGGLLTTKAQTSLRICADWSAPLLFAFWKVTYEPQHVISNNVAFQQV